MLDNIYQLQLDQVATIEWQGDPLHYDLQLYELGQGREEFWALTPNQQLQEAWNTDLKFYIDTIPHSRKCIVITHQGEWIVKIFKDGWYPYHGYETIDIVKPKFAWSKNPELDKLMTFKDNPFGSFEPNRWDSDYTLTWYIDPRFNPLDDKVWAFSCQPLGREVLGTKDMGYVVPDVSVEFNPHLPDLGVDIDQCYPPFWELSHECAYELDPIHQTSELTERMWVVKIAPNWRNPGEWKWLGIVTPELQIEYNTALPELTHDLDYVIPWHDFSYEHVWYLDSKQAKNEKIWAIRAKVTNDINGEKEIGIVTPLLADHLDVVFISYNEPNAEENWQRVLAKAPYAKRVHGVKGIFNAHKAAAKLAKTDMFFVVDGDAHLVDEWEFNFQPGIFDRDCSYVWNSRNPVNDLIYENGGIKLFPRALLMKQRKWKTLDMFTTISSKIKVVDTVSNVTTFNTDEFSAWRSAFRECVKLYTVNQMTKLNTWLTKGEDRHHGSYAISGANAGYQYAMDNKDNQQVLSNINNYEWLEEQFNYLYPMLKNEKPSVFNYKPIKIVKKEEIVLDPTIYTKLEHSNPSHADWFVVNWCLGNTCNFSCSYCPKDLHDASIAWPELDVIKNFILRVKQAHPNKKLYFEFTGGEVTLYKHFIDVCKFCTEHDIKVGLISNGSRTIRYWEENKQYFDHVCLSFHPEEADEKHFIEVVKLLHNELRTHVNIMMSPEKFDFCYAVANKVKNLGNISMALQPLIHDFGDTLYDYNEFQKKIFDKQHELIVKHIKYTKSFDYYRGAMVKLFPDGSRQPSSAQRFVSDKTNDWSGWKCYAGVEQLIVDKDGSIHRGWCKEGGPIGHIADPELNVAIGPVVCGSTMCHCNFDIMCTKEK